ncbi:MAG: hypothetical protein AAFX93_04955 [Verrucomicrobiota bacterium]
MSLGKNRNRLESRPSERYRNAIDKAQMFDYVVFMNQIGRLGRPAGYVLGLWLLSLMLSPCWGQSSLSALSPEMRVAAGMQKLLPDMKFNKRLSTPSDEDHLLLFSNGNQLALVAWTEGEAKRILAPASPMDFLVYNTDGKPLGSILAQGFVLEIILSQEPGIYVPKGANALLMIAALAERVEPRIRVKGPAFLELTCDFVNPLNEPLILSTPGEPSVAIKPGKSYTVRQDVIVGRDAEPIRLQVGASGIYQDVTIEVENPLLVDVRADLPGRLTVDLINPAGTALQGRMSLSLVGDSRAPFVFPVEMKRGESIESIQVPMTINLPLPKPIEVSINESIGDPREDVELTRTSPLQFAPIAGFEAAGEGKPVNWMLKKSGESFADLRAGNPPGGAPWGENSTLILAYTFENAGASLAIAPANPIAGSITQLPNSVGMWIRGDGSGNLVSMRWRDGQGNRFSSRPRPMSWKGWRYETFALDSKMVPPIRWESLLTVDSVSPSSGAAMVCGPVLNYGFDQLSKQAEAEVSVEVEDDVTFGNPVKLDRSQLAPVQ